MKSCPRCLTQYTDDTLQYCLQDGTPLTPSSPAELSTVVMGETETLVNPRSAGPGRLDTQPDITSGISPGTYAREQRPRSYIAVVAATVLVMFLVFGILGFGAFLYYRNKATISNTNVGPANTPKSTSENRNAVPAPSPTPTAAASNRSASPLPSANSQGRRTVDEETREEVTQLIGEWREATEEMDIDTLMTHYAPSVDYYNRRAANIDFIRADKNRAFARFDDISMKISNLEITSDETDGRLTVTFDKEWRFKGERTSTGKVRQLLQLGNINGSWRIISEKDLRVY